MCALSLSPKSRQIDRREWWLWGFAVLVTVVLTAGIVFLTFFRGYVSISDQYWADLRDWVRGLAALVLLFDIYTVYQHLQLQRVRRELAHRDELFHLITENAADMIAVVDESGHRLYNSPAYATVLGYSPEELSSSESTHQIHPDDRARVDEAAAKARATGRGERLEYRMLHKDGTWRILESTANLIDGPDGETGRLVIVNRDITDRKRAEELVLHNAFHDAITALPNRFLFVDRVRQALMRSRRRKEDRAAVLLVDIDEFKVVNDSLGHSSGDLLLVAVAQRLTECMRQAEAPSAEGERSESEDYGLARFGGDEFAILLEDVSLPTDAIRIAQQVENALKAPFEISSHQIVVTASIGVALSGAEHFGPEDLIRDAELAMYRAKRTGKAHYEVFDPGLHSTAVKRLQLETDLRRAVERGELVVFYQPIVSMSTGKITGFEALSRWRRGDTMVQPADFIPVAEETGLIIPMNRALMLEACRQIKAWQASFACTPPLSVSVNITSRQFGRPNLPREIGEILTQAGTEAATIHLEITETLTMQDADTALSRLSQLKALGVHLSIDDFGTGFSSLSRLQRFPVDALKIDRVFISGMTSDQDSFGIVRLITTLAHSMGLQVVAEGAETEAQIQQLKQLGCEMVQGFYYSPPVSANDAFSLLLRDYGTGVHAQAALGAHVG